MNAQFKTLMNETLAAVRVAILSKKKAIDAMRKFAPAYAKATLADQLEYRNAVATLVQEITGEEPAIMKQGVYRGSLGFKGATTNGGTLTSDAARKMMAEYLPLIETDAEDTKAKDEPAKTKSWREVEFARITKSGATKAQVRALIAMLQDEFGL